MLNGRAGALRNTQTELIDSAGSGVVGVSMPRRRRGGRPVMLRHHVAAALVGAILLAIPASGHGQQARLDPSKFGLTPSHVFSLWVNINNCLLAVARELSRDRDFHERLGRLSPMVTDGKNPSDVLERVLAMRVQIDRVRRAAKLRESAHFRADSVEITPSIVFLTSGDVLDGLAGWYVLLSDPKKPISRFYVRHKFTGKTPSEVFGLVDLAQRRLELIRKISGARNNAPS